jgi:hypothetical protein
VLEEEDVFTTDSASVAAISLYNIESIYAYIYRVWCVCVCIRYVILCVHIYRYVFHVNSEYICIGCLYICNRCRMRSVYMYICWIYRQVLCIHVECIDQYIYVLGVECGQYICITVASRQIETTDFDPASVFLSTHT